MLKKIIMYAFWWIYILSYFLITADKNPLILIFFTAISSVVIFVVKIRKNNTVDDKTELSEEKYDTVIESTGKCDDKNVSEGSDKKVKKKTVLRKFRSKEHVLKLVLSECLTVSALLLIIDLFEIQCSFPIVLFIGVFISFLIWLEWGRKTSVYGIIVLVFGFILIGFIQKNSFATEGILILYNRIVDVIARTSGFEFGKFVINAGETSYYLYLSYIMSLAAAFFGLISYFIVSHRQKFFLYVYIAFISVFLMGFRLELHWLYFVFFIISVAFISVYHHKNKADKELYNIFMWIIIIMLVSLGISYPINKTIRTHRTPIDVITDNLEYGSCKTDSYGTGAVGGHKLRKSDTTALKISMSNPSAIYLKGFIGHKFNGNRWCEPDNESIYNSRQLFYLLSKNGFHSYEQMGNYIMLASEDLPLDEINIELVGVGNKYLFMPYETYSLKNQDAVAVNGDLIEKESEVSEYELQLYSGMYEAYTEYTDADTESVIFETYNLCQLNYEEFVYNNYLHLDENEKKVIKEVISRNNAGIQPDSSDYATVSALVKKIINNEISYDESVKYSFFDNNCIDTLFNDYKKGFDVHFATAATLMFRYFGIPARYVEGYIVTLEEAANISRNTAYEVKGSNAHAWTEIYVSGIGWVPVEILDNYYEKMFVSSEEIVIDFALNEVEDNGVTDENSGIRTNILTFLIVILLIVLGFFAVVFIRRIVIIKKRTALFNSNDLREAVNGYYGYFCQVLKFCGLYEDGENPSECLRKYKDILSEDEINDFDKMCSIFTKASNSGKIKKKDRDYVSGAVQNNVVFVTERQTLLKNIGLYIFICV